MTLPSSGPMTAAMINVELGRAASAPFDINGEQERALAQKPSGLIKFSDFYGKSNGDPFWGNVLLLLHCDGTLGSASFPDSSTPANTITAGSTNARVAAPPVPIGADFAECGAFSGVSTSFLKATSVANEFNPSVAAWTAECFFYQTGGSGAIMGCTNAIGGTGWRLNASGLAGSVASAWGSRLSWAAPANNAWHHIAVVVYSDNTVSVFLNGVSQGTAGWTQRSVSAGQPLCIGIGSNSNQESFFGYIDEVRYTVAARYTANFTPPTAPFPNL